MAQPLRGPFDTDYVVLSSHVWDIAWRTALHMGKQRARLKQQAGIDPPGQLLISSPSVPASPKMRSRHLPPSLFIPAKGAMQDCMCNAASQFIISSRVMYPRREVYRPERADNTLREKHAGPRFRVGVHRQGTC